MQEILNLIKSSSFDAALNSINKLNAISEMNKYKLFYQKLYCFYRLRRYKKVIQQINRRFKSTEKPKKYLLLEIQSFYNLQRYSNAYNLLLHNPSLSGINTTKLNNKKLSGTKIEEEYLINLIAIQSLSFTDKSIGLNPFCYINFKVGDFNEEEKIISKSSFTEILKNKNISGEGIRELEYNSCFESFDFKKFPKNSLCIKQIEALEESEQTEGKQLTKAKLFQNRRDKLSEGLIYNGNNKKYNSLIGLLRDLLSSPLIAFEEILKGKKGMLMTSNNHLSKFIRDLIEVKEVILKEDYAVYKNLINEINKNPMLF